MSVHPFSHILSHWAAPMCDANLVYLHHGFSGATVAQLEVAGGSFAIKGWPTGDLSAGRLAAIHDFQKFLFQRGIKQVPVPIPTRQANTFVVEQKQLWQLEPWMPGQADFDSDPRPEKLRNIMQLLARLHLIAKEYPPREGFDRWLPVIPAATSPTIIERLHFIERWCDTDPATIERLIQRKQVPDSMRERLREILSLFQTRADIIRSELQNQLSSQFPLQPCLRDIWHDHVLFKGDEVIGLIDFGSCRSENPMIDLSRLLGSLIVDDPALWQLALDWYEALRPITPAERQLLSVFDRSQRVLSGMTWIERLILEGEQFHDPREVEDRLDHLLARMRIISAQIL